MAAGLIVILVVFYDLFQSVVLPRPAVGKIQIARLLIRPGWRIWRWVSQRTSRIEKSEARLAAFAPAALLGLFVVWALSLTVGYALVIIGFGDQFRPAIRDFPTAFYLSASTLVPLSFGDFVPEQGPARTAIVAESATGVALAALVITLLFSLYESFRAREEAVVSLDALAGAPPSGLHILETAAAHRNRAGLKEMFDEWRKWSAMVLESHLAYPLLIYFRSSHDNEAWINSFGAVMDAAILVMSSVEDEAEGSARLMFTVGNHLVEDLAWAGRFKTSADAIVEKDEYEQAVARLKKAGYKVKDGGGWQQFADMRSRYASMLNQVAHLLA
ncbi:MAG: ion channel, partial [Candidatus Dormibacteraceae bacterium]